MTSHIHMIISSRGEKLEDIMREMKKHTSAALKTAIKNHPGESRREWMLWMMERSGQKNGQNLNFQLWQQDNHPILLFDQKIIQRGTSTPCFGHCAAYSRARDGEFICINGQLHDDNNPVIFGFGDELDEDYLKMERERAKGYFEHIKSFWYFQTSNYWQLIRFIDCEEYIIHVLGHSCGLSDRTMLHMIFEHPNCKSIKIFYYGDETSNNYTEITYEIARHFNDKELMRRRIIPLDRSMRMPQFNDQQK
jgi:hypothetical protein